MTERRISAVMLGLLAASVLSAAIMANLVPGAMANYQSPCILAISVGPNATSSAAYANFTVVAHITGNDVLLTATPANESGTTVQVITNSSAFLTVGNSTSPIVPECGGSPVTSSTSESSTQTSSTSQH